MRRQWLCGVSRLVAVGTCLAMGLGGSSHSALYAQESTHSEETPQNLTVWIVRPVTAVDRAIRRAQQDARDISVYRESTAGDFGRPSSEVGQTAGSYGKPASEAGTNASDVGQTAGSYGQTASSLPSNVKSQTSGSYGQTAGSFGTSASDFNGAPPQPQATSESAAAREGKGAQWADFQAALHKALPNLQVRFAEVYGVTLRQSLAAVAGTGNFPDVLLSDRMPDGWVNGSRGSVLVGLARSGKTGKRQVVFHDAYGLARSPHPAAAREFLEWWYGQDLAPKLRDARLEGPLSPAAGVAVAAVTQVLSGGTLDGAADRDMAAFSGLATRAETLGVQEAPSDLQFHADVVRAQSNGRFAVVLLHAQCASGTAYCDLYPVVMLRADERGAWKVLQLSLSGDGGPAAESFELASEGARPAQTPVEVAMPKLASPLDGDHWAARSGLDLWWDRGGGGAVAAVEWQVGSGRSAPASHLALVPNADAVAKVRVPAPFVEVSGPVRWRVWALGKGGVLRLTEWRTVNMVQ